ncbi:acid phosphatase AphA [Neorhizobium sp. NCHU2750]|uniref:acid phosphatase AphA n=1 Tax=Neorhizobium sp. NCHU2750 TaxID=1825976 RepID=UPI000E73420A|nr:acid phosphatase [Neorhizobium sp. NCHU2750]
MKFSACYLAILAALATSPAFADDTSFGGSTTDQLAHQDPIHWVDVGQIEKSLEGKPPMTVGFDIDDTVLFSSPCFFYGQQKYSPGKFDYLKNQAFWDDINKNCDINYSIPKDVAAKLIAMHTKRGDTIYFITGRTKSEGERVTETIKRDFNMDKINPVVFTAGDATKTAFLKDKGVKIYYGDADGDMKQAIEVGARPIRVLRASNTTYKPMPKNGSFGEEVIVDSDH